MTDNELIAEFMGYRKIEGSHLYRDPDSTVYVSDARDFAYHCRWDWLMPVVEKIGQLSGLKTKGGYYVDLDMFTISHLTIWAELETVYKAVVEFIKWYNENKTK